MKRYSNRTKMQCASLAILFSLLLISCGKTTSESASKSELLYDDAGLSGIAIATGNSVVKMVGGFSIIMQSATASANRNISFMIVSPVLADTFDYSLSITSNASVVIDGSEDPESSRNLSKDDISIPGLKGFSLMGTESGQVITATIGITGYTEKAVFQIAIQ
jgi:hypothetical protein